MAQTRKKNIGKAVLIEFIVLIMIIIAGIILTSLVFKNDDVTPSFMGYSVYLMNEDGMGNAVPKGSLVMVKNYSPSNENLGDAVLCENVKGVGTTVLRLCEIVPNTETVVYKGFYDNNKNVVYEVEAKNMVGKAVSYDPTLGKIISFVTSIKGKMILVVIPLLMMLVVELIIHLIEKNNSKNAKNYKRPDEDVVAKNSPLNPQKLASHSAKSGPLTIDEFILGLEEPAIEDEPTIEIRGEKPQDVDATVEKIKREKAKITAVEPAKDNTVKIERVRVVPTKKVTETPKETVVEEEEKIEEKPLPQQEEPQENSDEVLEKPQTETRETTEEKSEQSPEISEEKLQTKTQTDTVETIPDSSLERLIKLMEENEKLLKSLADKD